jgi:SRSO17 transposase
MTFLLKFKIFKPQRRLKEGDTYKTKPELGDELAKELQEMGFNIKRVLADSLYGESDSNFISILGKLGMEYAVIMECGYLSDKKLEPINGKITRVSDGMAKKKIVTLER